MIVIVDYGMGNLRSVQKAFERINTGAKISSNPEEILSGEKLVLPGVGHFKQGVANIKEKGLYDILNEEVLSRKKYILGICLGMQLMTEFSEEGNSEGFGWIKADTRKFIFDSKALKIPHMGWNNVQIQNDDPLFNGIDKDSYFYFVHSYFVSCSSGDQILSSTNYGKDFVSSFRKDNVLGCQFHPEKSHDAGLQILKNFTEL